MAYALNVGDRVIITNTLRYAEIGHRCTGTVHNTHYDNVAVRVDYVDNPRSSYNCFYFKKKDLQPLEAKEKIYMEGNYRIAHIKFVEGHNTDKTYRYACYDNDICEGDMCVVMSENHGMGIARVDYFSEKTEEKLTREIICKCDFNHYWNRLATRTKKRDLEKKMQCRAAELQKLTLFQLLAEKDPSMQELLNEYQSMEEF